MAIEPFLLLGGRHCGKAALLELYNPAIANDQGQELKDQEDLASRSRVCEGHTARTRQPTIVNARTRRKWWAWWEASRIMRGAYLAL